METETMTLIGSKPKTPKGKVFISQPMQGFSNQEILRTRIIVTDMLIKLGYEVVNSLLDDSELRLPTRHPRIAALAWSLGVLADCDTVAFCPGWNKSHGCRVEYATALEYNLKRLEVNDELDDVIEATD